MLAPNLERRACLKTSSADPLVSGPASCVCEPNSYLCRVNGHLSHKLAVGGHVSLIDSWEATLNKLAPSQLIKVTLLACISQDDYNEQLCLSTSPGLNMINGRGKWLFRKLVEAPVEGAAVITVPLPHLGIHFLHFFTAITATKVGCQSPIFFPHPPTLLDMTNSLLGLLTTRPIKTYLVIMKNTVSLAMGLSLRIALSKPPIQDFILVILP